MNYVDFNSLFEQSIKKNWDLDALTDYEGKTLQYNDVARKVEKLHILFENAGYMVPKKLWKKHMSNPESLKE